MIAQFETFDLSRNYTDSELFDELPNKRADEVVRGSPLDKEISRLSDLLLVPT
jgi:hypothetical protein